MLAYANDLMMAVIVAATAFAGLTIVMFGQVSDRASLVGLSRSSLTLGIISVLLAISWFLWGQAKAIAYLSVLALLFQMLTSWAAVDRILRFWERKQ